MAYIKTTDTPSKEGCVLCNLHQADPANDQQNYVLYRGTTCYVVLNLYPYNTGHLMVVPYEHTADLAGLDTTCGQELFFLSQRSVAILTAAYGPHGFNMGMNLGRSAGAGIDQHLHMHILPRWNGDTNFMPLLGGTKLVPEALEDTYSRLISCFAQDEILGA
jgi:ATP adenylyltransferase